MHVECNYYLTHTPLHILYALSLQKELAQKNAVVAVLNDFESAPAVVRNLRRQYPHLQFELLPGTYEREKIGPFHFDRSASVAKAHRHIAHLQATRAFHSFVEQHKIQTLYIFNDTRPDIQHMMHLASRRDQARIAYVEDGAGFYLSYAKPPSRPRHTILSLIYGPGYRRSSNQATHPLINDIYALFPDAIRSDIDRTRVSISPMPLFTMMKAEVRQLTEVFSDNVESIANLPDRHAILVCLPLASEIASTDAYIEFILTQMQDDLLVLVKYHPREESYFVEEALHGQIRIIDQSIPAELICLLLGHRIQTIYASFSSILLSAQFLIPGVKCISLIPEGDYVTSGLRPMMEAAGIEMVYVPSLEGTLRDSSIP